MLAGRNHVRRRRTPDFSPKRKQFAQSLQQTTESRNADRISELIVSYSMRTFANFTPSALAVFLGHEIVPALCVLLLGDLSAACSKGCPAGTELKNELCHRIPAEDLSPTGETGSPDAAGSSSEMDPFTDMEGSKATAGSSATNTGTSGMSAPEPQSQAAAGARDAGFQGSTGAAPMTAGTGSMSMVSNANAGSAASATGCGNGVLEPGETCDPMASCPTAATCIASDRCLATELTGDATTCTAKCVITKIEECSSGDGCCPEGCTFSKDNDCSPTCGDGEVGASESCEPTNKQQPCPTNCDDGNACTLDVKTGTPEQCNVACTHMPIVLPAHGDGCCPSGANATNDADCKPKCGNNVVESGEICDGNCPTSCDDRDECTIDHQTGSATTCDIKCSRTDSTSPSCLCGNGRKDPNESCDDTSSTRCQTSCNDGNSCTTDSSQGSPSTCDFRCVNTRITTPRNNDSCCPANANASNDNDCSAVCGNRVVEPGEKCDGNCPTTCPDAADLCTIQTPVGTGCNVACTPTKVSYCGRYTACRNNDNCDGPGGFNCSGFGVCIASETCVDNGTCPTVPGLRAACISGYCMAGCSTTRDCPPHTMCVTDSNGSYCRG